MKHIVAVLFAGLTLGSCAILLGRGAPDYSYTGSVFQAAQEAPQQLTIIFAPHSVRLPPTAQTQLAEMQAKKLRLHSTAYTQLGRDYATLLAMSRAQAVRDALPPETEVDIIITPQITSSCAPTHTACWERYRQVRVEIND